MNDIAKSIDDLQKQLDEGSDHEVRGAAEAEMMYSLSSVVKAVQESDVYTNAQRKSNLKDIGRVREKLADVEAMQPENATEIVR